MTTRVAFFLAVGILGSLLVDDVASVPCASGVTAMTVATRDDAQDLTDALECTGGGEFDVTWNGNVTVNQTIALRDGSKVTISAATSAPEGAAAVVDGEGEARLFFLSDASTLNLNGITLRGGWHDSNGSAIFAQAQATVNALNCEFKDNSARREGGAILAQDATLNFEGTTTFTGNSARNGGAIDADTSEISIEGAANFTHSVARSGGAIRGADTNISLSGNVYFANNTAGSSGGALYLHKSTAWSGGTTSFHNCTAAENGGAVFVSGNDAGLNLAGETYFVFNYANQGGAILARSASNVNITHYTSFVNNTAASGGAVFVSGAGFTVHYYEVDADDYLPGAYTPVDQGRIRFESNKAAISGGAILIEVPTIFVIGEATLSSNEALTGGGVSILDGGSNTENEIFFVGCIFEGNAATNGGGLHSTAENEMIYHSSFTDNYAETSGGAIYHMGFVTLQNVSFVENRASVDGMAVTSIGELDQNSNATFTGNTFHCPTDEYSVETNGNSDANSCRFQLVCTECSTGCDNIPYGLSLLGDSSGGIPACETLPSGVVHPPNGGATLETLELEEGYYRTSRKSSNILECQQRGVCLGGTNPERYCATGYEGPYCAACAENYEMGLLSGCQKCGGDTRRLAVGTFVVGLIVLLLVVTLILFDLVQVFDDQRDEEDRLTWKRKLASCRSFLFNMFPRTAVRIMVVVWQIVTQFAYIAGSVYPDVYEDFLAKISLVNLDIGRILSYSCILNTDFYVRLVVATVSPFLVLAILGGTYVIARKRNRRSDQAIRAARHKHISAALFVAFFVYSSVSYTIFQTYACEELDTGTFLRADYSLTCTTAKHKAYMLYAAVMAVVYPIGIPAVFAWLLGRNRQDLKSSRRDSMAHLEPLHDLWVPYKPSRYFFEVIECVRRVTLTSIAVFVFPNTAAQIAVVLLLAVVFLFLTESLSPFAKSVDMRLYRWGNAIVIGSMYVALLLKVDVSSENNQSASAFSGVLIAAHIFMILTVAVQSIVFVEGWNSVRKIVVTDRPVVRRDWSSRDLSTVGELEVQDWDSPTP